MEGAEPPALPRHLFSISVDDPILSIPRAAAAKRARKAEGGGGRGEGGHLEISQKPFPRVQIGLPFKTDTSVTPGGWCRSQRAPVFLFTSLRGDFPRSRSFYLKSQGLSEQSLSPLGPTEHRGTESLGWRLIPIKGEHWREPLGTQVRMPPDPVCCLTLLSLLLSVPTSVNPSEAPPTLNVPVCGATL